MSALILWWVVAGVLVIVELFIGTFYLLMIAIGVAAGGVAALLGAATPLQVVVAALIGVLGTILLRRSKNGLSARGDARSDPNVNMDIGQRIKVPQWADGRARVMYRGAQWDVELAPGADADAGEYTIRELRGSRLIVS
jgi:membrane protein implicated in regulation of membrane protease activity